MVSIMLMQGWTGLMEVASHGRIDIAKLLVAKDVDVNVKCWKEVG